ncbi:MAG: NUDIX hydrolase [Nocardioidaceae bacterium]
MTISAVVRAAGCVVWRFRSNGPQVLLVHRPRYDDWSFPKGKLGRGESLLAAAVREVKEETGLSVSIGVRLPEQQYALTRGQKKTVAYWTARASVNADITRYRPNDEVDRIAWTSITKALRRLSYPHDKDLLETFAGTSFDSSPLVILRHAKARNRSSWAGDDGERPLLAEGRAQARALVSLLGAYDVRRVVSSDATRCIETVLPFVDATGVKLRLEPAISEDGDNAAAVSRLVQKALAGSRRLALCSHRPLLPEIFASLGLDPVPLLPGAVAVVHRKDGEVVALETHP